MQLRKLIRILKEMEQKNGGYIEVCIDRDYVKNSEFNFVTVNSVQEKSCIWNPENSINENQRHVLVLGE